jgi:flagellar FliL protein
VTEDARSPTPKKSRKKLFVIVFAVLALIAGGGAVGFKLLRHPAPAHDATPESGPQGLLSLDPFVVNLADQGGSRFLRVNVRLVVGAPEQAERVQKNDIALMRVRSSILELLTQQTADKLVTPDGKAALKHAIATRVEPVLEGTKVTDVLFSDFVVQF